MSISVMSLVWERSPYQGSTLITLLALADWSNDEGVSWPSITTLAKKSRQSERNTIYCLQKIKDEGFLTIKRRKENSSIYTINIKSLSEHAKIALTDLKLQNGADNLRKNVIEMSQIAPNTSDIHHDTSVLNTNHPLFQETVQELKESPDLKEFQAKQIYDAYPRQIGRAKANQAIIKRLKEGISYEWLMSRVQLFAKSPAGQAGDYTPYPATWFNQERYNDDEKEWNRRGTVNGKNKAELRESRTEETIRAVAERYIHRNHSQELNHSQFYLPDGSDEPID